MKLVSINTDFDERVLGRIYGSLTKYEYLERDQTLRAEIFNGFRGSPVVLTYKYEFKNSLNQSLKFV